MGTDGTVGGVHVTLVGIERKLSWPVFTGKPAPRLVWNFWDCPLRATRGWRVKRIISEGRACAIMRSAFLCNAQQWRQLRRQRSAQLGKTGPLLTRGIKKK